MKDKFEDIKNKFIIEGEDFLEDILIILVKRGVKTNKEGNPILLGDFGNLSKKKRDVVYNIAKKVHNCLNKGFASKIKVNFLDLVNLKNLDSFLLEMEKMREKK